MVTTIHFTKMHGLGNDFVMLDTITQSLKVDTALVCKIADRHFGIGCDQVLLIEPPNQPGFDLHYRVFNADGKEVAQCGNGARCLGRYVYDKGLATKKQLKISTQKGALDIDISDLRCIQVNMGQPVFDADNIPLHLKAVTPLPDQGRYRLTLQDQPKDVTILSMGNPHCVFFVPAINEAPVEDIGAHLQQHPAFPKGVNVSFVQVLARNHIKCRVFERGAGETLACGSGACAAVVSGILSSELNEQVKVDMKGGNLTVRWDKDTGVHLSGPTISVFQGKFCVTSQDSEL